MYWLWNPNPVAFTVGDVGISWYGILWALGFLIAQRLVIFMYGKEKKPGRDHDALLVYLIVGTVVGARIAHCLFYDPGYYLRNPVSVLKVWEGGLASHGAAAGILTALFIFSRRKKDQPFFWLADRIAIVAAIVGGLVRVGNFVNSEIIGTRTQSSYGVVFVAPVRDAVRTSDPAIINVAIRADEARKPDQPGLVPLNVVITTTEPSSSVGRRDEILHHVQTGLVISREAQANIQLDEILRQTSLKGEDVDMSLNLVGIARHPVQLYEATVCFILAASLFAVWLKRGSAIPHGQLFGWFLAVIFGSRFLLEYFKAAVTPGDSQLPVSIGQFLSLPFALVGLSLLISLRRQASTSTPTSGKPG
jgi:phosphatidylglycerol---prolipoprotein diacylglyceryl transferase